MKLRITQPHPAAKPTVVGLEPCCHAMGEAFLGGGIFAWKRHGSDLFAPYARVQLVSRNAKRIGVDRHCRYCGTPITITDVTDPHNPKDRSYE